MKSKTSKTKWKPIPAPGRNWGNKDSARVVSTDNPILTKLLKLKYRINDAYKKYGGDGLNTKKDKSWVMSEIKVIRGGGTPDKSSLEYANKLWSDYEKYTI